MKNILLLTLLSLSIISQGFSQTEDVSSYEEKLLNWQNKDISGRIMGTNTYKAYNELLNGKTPKKKIIVAVIDAGIDITHEDLKANIWVNTDEIPDNGIDDDKNGYIDDINGWNFLGNAEGENIDRAPLEKTRIYRKLRDKYRSVDESEVADSDKAEFKLYLKLKKEITTELRSVNKQFEGIKGLHKTIHGMYDKLSRLSGQKITTSEELKNYETQSDEEKKLKRTINLYASLGLSIDEIDEYYDYLSSQKEAHLKTSFFPRSDIIGDDVNDINDKNYGNSNVTGPDAFHGTFCAGIIGAKQNNKLGINGIANHVLLMSLRAVPNGDEYDKDVALAIRYATDNGAQVINMSFGKDYTANKKMVDDAMLYAESKGVLLVHAAGNDSKNIDTTSNYPTDVLLNGSKVNNLICVGASTISTKKKLPADFSNFGNENVDLFAPGLDVVSTTVESEYEISQGTSFAAPVVSGVAALVWSYYPDLTAVQMKEILIKSATKMGKKKVIIPGTRKKKTRFRELCVSDGVVNTYNALLLAEEMS
ncbi:MAG: S8 family peptidase, partial [Flavobacteriales bacterium]